MRLLLAIGMFLCVSFATAAPEDKRLEFNIAPQALSTALDLLILQADIELLYDSNIVIGKSTPGLVGRFTVAEAMARLLEDTGLDHVFTAPQTIAILPSRPVVPGHAAARGASGLSQPRSLPVLVVSATRSEQIADDVPAASSVVTINEINQRRVSTVDQALNLTPGGYFRRGKGLMDTAANISLRGLPTMRRTAILLNGIPLNDSYTGSINLASINVDDIERIEVVRGPFSSLYGSNAMGGVINIVSKQPDGAGARLNIGYGDGFGEDKAPQEMIDISMSANLQATESMGMRVSYRHRKTDGYPTDFVTRVTDLPVELGGAIATTDTLGEPRFLIGHKGDNGYRDDSLALAARYHIGPDSDLDLHLIRSRSEYVYQHPRSLLRNPAGDEQFITGTGSIAVEMPTSNYLTGPGGADEDIFIASHTGSIGGVGSKLTLGYVHQRDGWFVTPDVTATLGGGVGTVSNTETAHRIADWQLEALIGNRHTLTGGLYFRHGEAENSEHSLSDWRDRGSVTGLVYEAEGRDLTYALFLQHRFEINDKWTSYLGIRQDWWETRRGLANSLGIDGFPLHYPRRSDRHTSPKLALVYQRTPATRYRLATGSSFRAPAIFELYRTWLSTVSDTTFESNPDLGPETVFSWEIGVDHHVSSNLRLNATLFGNRMRDFIYRTMVTSSPSVQRFENTARAHSRGVEIGLAGNFSQVEWQANYTYTDAVIDDNPLVPASEGMRIIQIPKNVASIALFWQQGRLGVNGTARYVDERFNRDDNNDRVKGVFGAYDSYILLDMSLGYQFTDNLAGSLSIDNLADRQWYDFYLSPGRAWFMRLTLDY